MLGKLATGEVAIGEVVTGEIVLGKLCWGNDLTPEKICKGIESLPQTLIV